MLPAAACCKTHSHRLHSAPHTAHTHPPTRTHTAETQTTIDLQVRRVVPSVVLLVLGSERQPLPRPGQMRASEATQSRSDRTHARRFTETLAVQQPKRLKLGAPPLPFCPLSFLFLNIFFLLLRIGQPPQLRFWSPFGIPCERFQKPAPVRAVHGWGPSLFFFLRIEREGEN